MLSIEHRRCRGTERTARNEWRTVTNMKITLEITSGGRKDSDDDGQENRYESVMLLADDWPQAALRTAMNSCLIAKHQTTLAIVGFTLALVTTSFFC